MKANEDNFISLIKKRREEGIRYVMERYGGLLASIVGKRLYCMPDRIDECMNDIFFGIWNNIGSYDPERSSFKSWAAGVARFHAIDYLRKYGKQPDQTALEEVELAYAITIHKSQGSEYPAVIMPLLGGPRMLFNRNLLYTGVTRARSCVTILGSRQVVQDMIANESEARRYTSLDVRIKEVMA